MLLEGHPDTALTRHNLATLLADEGRRDEALALYRKALCEFPDDGVCQALARRLES